MALKIIKDWYVIKWNNLTYSDLLPASHFQFIFLLTGFHFSNFRNFYILLSRFRASIMKWFCTLRRTCTNFFFAEFIYFMIIYGALQLNNTISSRIIIIIIIVVILIARNHLIFSTLSLSPRPYHPPFLARPLDSIQCPHSADICKSFLVGQHLCVYVLKFMGEGR